MIIVFFFCSKLKTIELFTIEISHWHHHWYQCHGVDVIALPHYFFPHLILHDQMCVSKSPLISSQTLLRIWTCITTCVHIHLTFLMSSTPLHICMQKCVPCVVPCAGPSHPISSFMPWLECVHASVHVCMSIWLITSAPLPWHRYTQTCMPLYGPMCVAQ